MVWKGPREWKDVAGSVVQMMLGGVIGDLIKIFRGWVFTWSTLFCYCCGYCTSFSRTYLFVGFFFHSSYYGLADWVDVWGVIFICYLSWTLSGLTLADGSRAVKYIFIGLVFCCINIFGLLFFSCINILSHVYCYLHHSVSCYCSFYN